jgi:hypothetical protein
MIPDRDGRIDTLRNLIGARTNVLKARLIHGVGVDDLCVAGLKAVFVIRNAVCLAFERELRHSAVSLHLAIEHVPHREGVLVAKLEIKSRADIQPGLRICDGRGVVVLIATGAENICVNSTRIPSQPIMTS